MLNRMGKKGFAIGVIGFFISSIVYAVPPPAGVNEVVAEMGRFETSIQSENWTEAAASLQVMDTTFKDIFMQAQRDDFILEENLIEVQKNVTAQNRDKVEEAYVPFQKQYFNYVSNFDHEIHPILIKIEEHVTKRAPAAYAEKDIAGMLREMQTAGMLIDHGKIVLLKKGVPELEINSYGSKVQALGFAVKANNQEKVAELLTKLQETYNSFMQKYKN